MNASKVLVGLLLATAVTVLAAPSALAQSGRYWNGYQWVYYSHRPQVIGDTGVQEAGVYWNGYQWVRRTQQSVAFDTILDPNRQVIDPGSYQVVNYTQYDQSGVLWHYSGYKWTSYGQPHSEITRTALNMQAGGIGQQPSQTQFRSPGPGVGVQPSQTQFRSPGPGVGVQPSQTQSHGTQGRATGGAHGDWGR